MARSTLTQIAFKILGLLIIAASLVGGWLAMDYRHFITHPLPVGEQGHRHLIEPGTSVNRFARQLQQAGVLPHPHYLAWLARWEGKAQQIKAGEYDFSPGITPRELLDKVVSGAVVQHTLTVIEGWTFAQMLAQIQQHPVLVHTLGDQSPQQIMSALGYADQHPEGRFLADTYHFPRGTRDVDFLARAYKAMEAHLSEEWDNRDTSVPYKSAYEALIMASIIEKETALDQERAAIAGVFVRRLQVGMRLQTDPTVIYALGERFDGNLRRADLQYDSPYNTYRYAGLPPTPIALPGVDSLRAALHPASGDALYFVSRGDGSHQFSATLEQHNQAVRRYQLNSAATQ